MYCFSMVTALKEDRLLPKYSKAYNIIDMISFLNIINYFQTVQTLAVLYGK